MTREKMAELLYQVINTEMDAAKVMKDVKENNGKISGILENIPEYKIATVIFALEEEIASNEAKKSGKTKLLSACKSVLKSAVKDFLKRPFWLESNGVKYQCFLDGYRLICLTENNALNLEASSIDETNTSGFSGTLSDIMEKDFYESLKLPSITELKARIREIKANHKKDRITIVIDDVAMYNAEFLVNVMDAIESDSINYSTTKNGTVNSISKLTDKNGNMAFITPICFAKDEIKEPKTTIIVNNGEIIK